MQKLRVFLAAAAAHAFAHAAPVYEIVADFERPPASPLGPLVIASDGNLYGTTAAGGRDDFGTIFKITPNGTLAVLVHFTGANGSAQGSAPLAGLTPGPDGALYGTTSSGGAAELGTVFKFTTTGLFTTLVQFSGTAGVAKGSVPAGELVLAQDGNFYGTTQAGGSNDLGTIFKMTPDGVLTTLHEFTGTGGIIRGSQPRGRLALDAAGTTLFGVCAMGGANDMGTIFKITAAGAFTTLKEFTGTGNVKGDAPSGGLVRGTDGNYYGTTEAGGADNLGTIFRITSNGSLTTLHNGASVNGGGYAAALYPAPDGNLFGAAANGGRNDLGVIFQITSAGIYTVLAEFDGANGAAPRASLIAGSDGALYGTASAGAAGQRGAIFKTTTSGVLTPLSMFTNMEGWSPAGGLSATSDGTLLATLTEGGSAGVGTITKVTTAGVVTPIVTFTGAAGTARGAEPVGALMATGTGEFYGVTRRGGPSDGGTAFKLSSLNVFASLAGFGSAAGQFPEDGLVLRSDGFFYGTASEGGTMGFGTVFAMSAAGSRTVLVSFTGISGSAPGANPVAALALGDNGELFGTTAEGGASDKGTLFRIDSAGVYAPLVEFIGANGATPIGALVRAADGNFYGTTSAGGAVNSGTLFRLAPTGARTTIAEFSGTGGDARGSAPAATLLAAPDGSLYGTTSAGGVYGLGTLFRVSPTGALSTLFDFSGVAAPNPGTGGPGALLFGADGSLYGSTPEGGARGGGVIFRVRHLGPHVGSEPVRSLTFTGPMLEALVVTGGEATSVNFEYGITSELGNVTSPQSTIPGGVSPVRVSEILAGVSSGQTIFYRAKAVNDSGFSLGLVRSFTMPEAFVVWKLSELGNANAGDLADPDGDGLTLLHEYALSLSPLAPDRLPAAEMHTYSDGHRLALVFKRDPMHNDVTIEVQAAGDVYGPWTSIASSVSGGPMSGPGYFAGETPGSEVKTIEVRDTTNAGAVSQRFLRLHVVH